MDCKQCPLYATCVAPCAAVEAQLPKEYTADMCRQRGFGRREFLIQLFRSLRETSMLLEYRDVLTGRVRQVFDLKYNESLTDAEVAERLGINRRVVTTYIVRARALINKALRGYMPRQREKSKA